MLEWCAYLGDVITYYNEVRAEGVAPVEASSAGGVKHRLSRGGNRHLNMLLYLIALAQERRYGPAQAYMARRQQEGRTAREARRALKRHLVRRICHQWQACWTGGHALVGHAAFE